MSDVEKVLDDFTCQICNLKVSKKEIFNHVMTCHTKVEMLKFIKDVGKDVWKKRKV